MAVFEWVGLGWVIRMQGSPMAVGSSGLPCKPGRLGDPTTPPLASSANSCAPPLSPQNILLDTHTADAVHIDLGIAFEQVGWLVERTLVC